MDNGDAFESAARLAAGTSLAEAIDVSDAAAWTALDRAVRDHLAYRPSALPVSTWSHPEPGEPELALALCHHDGRIRQAALARAAKAPALLPLLVIRCADWVAPVREEARALLRDALPGLGTDAVAVLAAVVLRVARRDRGDAARDMLEAALRAGPARVLEAVLASGDRTVRRLAFRIAVDRRLYSSARLAAIAAADADVVVQDICSEAALQAAGTGTGDDVLRPLLRSRQGRVRSAGVTALHRTGRHVDAEAFLTDRSSLVRACARWVLRQAGTDPAPLYRALCAGAAVPPYAPVGLTECGTRADEDAGLLRGLTGHPVARVRASAVAGLRILEPADWRTVMPLLDDPSAAVVHEVTRTLAPHAAQLPEEELLARAAPDRPYTQRAAALRVMSEHYGGSRLHCALRMMDDPDPRLRARAALSADRGYWNADQRTPEQAEEMLRLLERHRDAFGRSTRDWIRDGLLHAVARR